NHPGKNRCPESEGSSSQPFAPLHCFRSDFPIGLTSLQEKGESLMGLDRSVGWVIQSLPSQATNMCLCTASEGSSAPLQCVRSNVQVGLTSMQEKDESLMGQDRSVGWVIQSLPSQATNVCPLLSGVLHYHPRTKTSRGLLPFLQCCGQREVLRHTSLPLSYTEVSTIWTSLPYMLNKLALRL
ncbi:hypothetical protein AVEN_27987-2-1, partial [Araneus ventricosus]